MAWWGLLSNFFNKEGLGGDSAPKDPKNLKEAIRGALIQDGIDVLYFILWFFTHFYIISTAFLFFSARGGYYFVTTGLVDALSEPYLGAIGIYVILKELRKKRINNESRHRGEIFVWAWLMLLIVSSILVISTDKFRFDDIMKVIITNSLASAIIYVAGLMHKP